MENNLKIRVNFGGFYYSIHDDLVERAMAFYFDMDDAETGEVDSDKIWYISSDVWQYARGLYCREWLNYFNNIFETSLKFDGLNSPRFYNFENDVIFAEISRADVLVLFKRLKDDNADLKKRLMTYMHERTRSRDGFISFLTYSDLFKKENRSYLVELMLDILIAREEENYPICSEDFYISTLPETVTDAKGYISFKSDGGVK